MVCKDRSQLHGFIRAALPSDLDKRELGIHTGFGYTIVESPGGVASRGRPARGQTISV
jgi:hypothetical protein